MAASISVKSASPPGEIGRPWDIKMSHPSLAPTASDIEALECVAQAKESLRSWEKEEGQGPWDRSEVNGDLRWTDPSELPNSFVVSGTPLYMILRGNQHIRWSWTLKAEAGSMYAIRDISHSKDGARYRGLKEVREILKDGNSTGRFMACYSLLSTTPAISDKNKDDGSEVLYLDGNLTLCRVFEPECQEGKLHLQAFLVPLFPSVQQPPKKRKIVSNVWKYFTKIKTNDDKHKLVYAACNCCNKILKAESQNGTKHLSDHVGSCTRKHPQQYSSPELCRSMGTWEGQCISGLVIIPCSSESFWSDPKRVEAYLLGDSSLDSALSC